LISYGLFMLSIQIWCRAIRMDSEKGSIRKSYVGGRVQAG
jgi:hypothetical protein